MNNRRTLPMLLTLVAFALPGLPTPAAGAQWSDVQEIFRQQCVICHQGANAPLGLRLDSHDGVMTGSADGAVIVAGAPEESELIRRVIGESLPRMPLTGPPWLGAEDIATLRAWIAAGAGSGPAIAATRPETQPQPVPQIVSRAEPRWADVAPLFLARCAKCHSPDGIMGAAPEGFVATGYDSLLAAGERARIVPGNPAASEVVRRIRGLSRPRMPFDGPPWLDQRQIALIEDWIAAGAPDDSGRAAPVPVGARVRFEGTLVGRWQLDDLVLQTTAATRIRKNPSPGDRVEVRGVVQDDGRILATRIRPR